MIDRNWPGDDGENAPPEVTEAASGGMPPPQFYSSVQVARMFGRTTRTVRHWIQTGRMKAFRIGRSQYITDAEIARVQGEEEG